MRHRTITDTRVCTFSPLTPTTRRWALAIMGAGGGGEARFRLGRTILPPAHVN
jgi:hypothetical protein